MHYRRLGRTDMDVSTISFGAWAIGGTWGTVDDAESLRALHAAVDAGMNFIDTADVYGDGRSERLVARLRRERPASRLRRHQGRPPAAGADAAGYSRENLTAWVERSLITWRRKRSTCCSSTARTPRVYDRPEVFGILDDLVAPASSGTTASASRRSTRRCARSPSERPDVQIIFNMFRLKPAEAFFPEAHGEKVGILARVPLASGLLTGKLRRTRRSPPTTTAIQPRGRGLRQGRDVLRRALRRGPRGGRRAASARPGGRDARAAGAALDPDVRRRHLRDPGRQDG